jgi:hypothetical protein
LPNDGSSSFDKASVMLEDLDSADKMIEVVEWGSSFASGDPITKEEWAGKVRGGHAINLPSTHPPPNATAFVLRGHFPDRSLALSEMKQIAKCEKRLPGRMGEQVVMVVDGTAGEVVFEKWHQRLVRDGIIEFHGDDFEESKLRFAAALAVKFADARDVFRFVIADLRTNTRGCEARAMIYTNLAKKWGKRNGGDAKLTDLLASTCHELGVDGDFAELGERLLGKGKVG